MADAGRYVFQCARDAHAQTTRLFDFVAPTAIALWNLRWQVQGYLAVIPNASQEDISARFALGSGIRSGHIKRACAEVTWDEQLSQFAAFVLMTTIAIFEDYVADIAACGGGSETHVREVASALQFPAGYRTKDRNWALGRLSASPSTHLAGVFAVAARQNRRYSGAKLDNLLTCYRYFKEVRNCLAHAGGRASDTAVAAYNAFAPLASLAALGLNEVPHHHALVKDEGIRIELRGVIGLADVILRIVTTYDAELSESAYADREVSQRLKAMPRGILLPADKTVRARRITKHVQAAGFPAPQLSASFESFLRAEGKIPAL